nr:hypothetical protein [uncultured Dyadobacter sp.]
MKTFTSSDTPQKVLVAKLLSFTMIGFLLVGGSCTETEIKEYEVGEPCFTKESLETVPWIKAELAWFQQPKMSFLRVSVYRYRSNYYLAFENVVTSGPISHIFNCSGQHLGKLNINYGEFYDNVELMTVLLEGKY